MTEEIIESPQGDPPMQLCPSCRDSFPVEELSPPVFYGYVSVNGERSTYGYFPTCANCTATCEDCEAEIVRRDAIEDEGDLYCQDCRRLCDGCGYVHNMDEVHYVESSDDYRCSECWDWCERCESVEVPSGDGAICYDCRNSRQGIRGYQTTVPTMWLGGPVKRKGGYYIGFELEISASDYVDASPVYDWAEQHLGDRGALDCKEDSSVEGFEIVSMPMTPQFFESVDWDSFFAMINEEYPLSGDEPIEHGLHVHVGRVAFQFQDLPIAAYSYLLGQGKNLERIARREPYHYCNKVAKPVSAAIIAAGKGGKQYHRIRQAGVYAGRDAINLTRSGTIEIRAFRSTREASELREAVRLVYLGADYIRHLRSNSEAMAAKSLRWEAFAEWVRVNRPEAYASISGKEESPRGDTPVTVTAIKPEQVNRDEFDVDEPTPAEMALYRIRLLTQDPQPALTVAVDGLRRVDRDLADREASAEEEVVQAEPIPSLRRPPSGVIFWNEDPF